MRRRFLTVTTLAMWPFPRGREIWYWDTFRPVHCWIDFAEET